MKSMKILNKKTKKLPKTIKNYIVENQTFEIGTNEIALLTNPQEKKFNVILKHLKIQAKFEIMQIKVTKLTSQLFTKH